MPVREDLAALVREDEELLAAEVNRRCVSNLTEALLMTVVSVLVPGLAHLRAGHTRAGLALVVSAAAGLTGLMVAAAASKTRLAELAVDPRWLTGLMVGASVLAAAWALLVLRSYAVVRPPRLSPLAELSGGTAVAVLCLLVVVPPLTVARYGYLQRDVVTNVFQAAPGPIVPVAAQVGATQPVRDAWQGVHRLNILLLGGDADTGRIGTRTDSMTVASVDTSTGETVLLSLPRNLQRIPLWDGSRLLPFPGDALLNTVYGYGDLHPELLTGRFREPGAELLKRTVGHILGIPVHFYGLVDMRSFRKIVEAMGGVRVCVDRPVPVPTEQVPGGVIATGCRQLSGRAALWYGRSRTGSSDYSRMSRQKCLLWAISRQATPLNVLRSFQRLAQVFKESVHTDLPRDLLPRLIDLSSKVRGARVTSVQFMPPLVHPGTPDYMEIKRLTAHSLRAQVHHEKVHNLRRTCS